MGMKAIGGRLLLVSTILAATAGSSHADRAVSPTDALGNWAVETKLKCCGPWETSYTYYQDSGGLDTQEVASSRIELGVRLWPIRGLYLGLSAGAASFGNDQTRNWARSQGIEAPIWTDAVLEGGYRRRLSPSIVVGGSFDSRVPTGTVYGTTGQLEGNVRAMLGFSFTPRWDFFIEPFGGRLGSEELHAGGYRAGWSAGFAYQRASVSFLGRGGNCWNRDAGGFNYVTVAGDLAFAWEFRPGLTVGFEFDGRESRKNATTHATFTDLLGGFYLSWVYYPTGHHRNQLRREDPRRGENWRWWNPDRRKPQVTPAN